MNELLEKIEETLQKNQPLILVSIVADHGSAPRGNGAFMLVSGTQRVFGTIGGGMLEYRATQIAQELIAKREGQLIAFQLTDEEKAGLGMVCGGDVDVLFTYLKPSDEIDNLIQEARQEIALGHNYWLILAADGSGVQGSKEIKDWDRRGSIIQANESCPGAYVLQLENKICVYIFGGGHLAQALVPLITKLHFECVVTDDRKEYASKELFPDAKETHVRDYTELDSHYPIRSQDYVVIVTRGHSGDFDAEAYALRTPAHYIGVVGSKTKIKYINERLIEAGYSQTDLDRVTTPIGISIGSETPMEIAVSIAAQLIQVRANKKRSL